MVSTRVGGLPEILPKHMISLAEPEASAMTAALLGSLGRLHDATPWYVEH